MPPCKWYQKYFFLLLLFFGDLCCQSAFVRDVLPRSIENNMGKAVDVSELTIDFEYCSGHADETLELNVSRRDGSSVPVKVRCEGIYYQWESELIQIIPAATTQHKYQTCEVHPDKSLLLELNGRQAQRLDTLGDLVGSLYQGSNFAFDSNVSNTSGVRRRFMLETEEEDDFDTCLPINSDAFQKYKQNKFEIDQEQRCKGFDSISKFWEDMEEEERTFRDCKKDYAEFESGKNIYVDAHPLCIEGKLEKDYSTLETRWKWMRNQYAFSQVVAKSLEVSSSLDFGEVQRKKKNKPDLVVFNADQTADLLQNAVETERLRQILSVGPYDKMHACLEAQAHYLYTLLRQPNTTYSLTRSENTTVAKKWFSRQKNQMQNDWRKLENEAAFLDEIEFVKEYIDLLKKEESTNIYLPNIRKTHESYTGGDVWDEYDIFENLENKQITDANLDKYDSNYLPIVSNRHRNLVHNQKQNIIQWQWDPPCSSLENDDSSYEDQQYNFLDVITRESHGSSVDGCGMRLNIQDNRCKFQSVDSNPNCLSDVDKSNFQCIPHFVEVSFVNASLYWNSLECVNGNDEEAFFCGLADDARAPTVVEKCFGPNITVEDARQSLVDSLLQMWDEKGVPKYSGGSYKDIFCSSGEIPNENNFVFRPFTDLLSGDVEIGKECPCSCVDPDVRVGYRVCPLNPWEKLDANSKLQDLGQMQGCVRNRGLTSCIPFSNQKYAKIPYQAATKEVVNRCDSEIVTDFTRAGGDAIPTKVFGDSSIESFLLEVKDVSAAGFVCNELELNDDEFSTIFDRDNNITVAEIIQELMNDPCSVEARNSNWDWKKGKKDDNYDGDKPSKCHESFWHALDDVCLSTALLDMNEVPITSFAQRLLADGRPLGVTGNNAPNYQNSNHRNRRAYKKGKRFWGDFSPTQLTGDNYWMDFDNDALKNWGDYFRGDCIGIDRVDVPEKRDEIRERWFKCNSENNFNGKDYGPEYQVLSSCYEIVLRTREDLVNTRWEARSAQNLKRILNYVQEESPQSEFVKSLTDNYYRLAYSIAAKQFLNYLYRFETPKRLKCNALPAPGVEQSIESAAYYLDTGNNREKALNLQTYGYNSPRENKDAPSSEGATKRNRKFRGIYDEDGTTLCIDSVIQISDHSDYRANLYALTLNNRILATDIEQYFQDQLDINKDSALAVKAQSEADGLKRDIENSLSVLKNATDLNENQLRIITDMFQQTQDYIESVFDDIDNLVGDIGRRKKEGQNTIVSLLDFVEEVSDNSEIAIEVYRESARVLEEAIQNTYGLVQAVLQTTSQTRDLVSQTQALLYTIRHGDQDYRRHTRDVLTFMGQKWLDFNNSDFQRGVRGAVPDETPYIPFVARIPATPPGPNVGLPRIDQLGAIPAVLAGKASVVPIETMRGWTLEWFPQDSMWHWVQQRIELLCSIDGILNNNQFTFMHLRTWTTMLGPKGCRFDNSGDQCRSCRTRIITHHCAIESSDDLEFDNAWRREKEASTLYNRTWAKQFLKNDLEDLDESLLYSIFGCRNVSVPPLIDKLASTGSLPWEKASALKRIEVESSYVDPVNSTLQKYRRVLDRLSLNKTAILYKDETGQQLFGYQANDNNNEIEEISEVPLVLEEQVHGVSAADVFTWQSTMEAVCQNPLLWAYPDLNSNTQNVTQNLGSPRMTWLSGRGYRSKQTLMGSTPVYSSVQASESFLQSQEYLQFLNTTDDDLISYNTFAQALEQAQRVICSPDLTLAAFHADMYSVAEDLWTTLVSENPSIVTFERDLLYGSIEFTTEAQEGADKPAWLFDMRTSFQFVSYEIVESFRSLPYSTLFQELRAAKTGLLPPEGLEIQFLPRVLLRDTVPTYSNAASLSPEKTVPLTSELSGKSDEEKEVYGQIVEPLAVAQIKAKDVLFDPSSSVVTGFKAASTGGKEAQPRPTYKEGRRCYESSWLTISDLGLPLYRWKLLPEKTEIRVTIETEAEVQNASEWRKILSGVKVVDFVKPDSLIDEFREFYWLGNLSCLLDSCTSRDQTSTIPAHIYDLDESDLLFSRSPFADARRKPNAVRFEISPGATYGPLFDKLAGKNENQSIPEHLFRSPSFEEYRSQWFLFPQKDPSFAKRTFYPTQASSSASEYKRLVSTLTNGDATCVGGDQKRTNCRFIENMRLESVKDTNPMSLSGHTQEWTARSAVNFNRRVSLPVTVQIPEDVNVRGQMASSPCPRELRILQPFSHQVALQAYIPVPGEWIVTTNIWQSSTSNSTQDVPCHTSSPFVWTVSSEEISRTNHFVKFSLPRGLCPLRKIEIYDAITDEKCLVWETEDDLTVYVNSSFSHDFAFSYGYALHEATVRKDLLGIIAGFTKAEQSFQYIAANSILAYQNTQISKTEIGWTVEVVNKTGNNTNSTNTSVTSAPSDNIAYTSGDDSSNETENQKNQGAGAVTDGGEAFQGLGNSSTDPSTLDVDETKQNLGDTTLGNTQAQITNSVNEMTIDIEQVIAALYVTNSTGLEILDDNLTKFAEQMPLVEGIINDQIPSFYDLDMDDDTTSECFGGLLGLSLDEFTTCVTVIDDLVKESNTYKVRDQLEKSTKVVVIVTSIIIGIWIFTLVSLFLGYKCCSQSGVPVWLAKMVGSSHSTPRRSEQESREKKRRHNRADSNITFLICNSVLTIISVVMWIVIFIS